MSLRAIYYLAKSCFWLLVRDKIFVPAIFVGIAFAFAAAMVSDWSVEDFELIVFQINAFGVHVTGGVVAMVWGGKIIAESKMQGSIESQLATPISRSTWLLGNFMGLSSALLMLWGILLVVIQVVMIRFKFGWLDTNQLYCLVLLGILWLLVASFAFFFGSFCGSAIALFGTLTAWFSGMTIGLAVNSITDATHPVMASVLKFLGKFWDLTRLNTSNFLYENGKITFESFMWHGLYGVAILILFLSASCIIFEKRDLI